MLKDHVRFVCLSSPEPFFAISLWYDEFPQMTDEEVRELLDRAADELRPRQPDLRRDASTNH